MPNLKALEDRINGLGLNVAIEHGGDGRYIFRFPDLHLLLDVKNAEDPAALVSTGLLTRDALLVFQEIEAWRNVRDPQELEPGLTALDYINDLKEHAAAQVDHTAYRHLMKAEHYLLTSLLDIYGLFAVHQAKMNRIPKKDFERP